MFITSSGETFKSINFFALSIIYGFAFHAILYAATAARVDPKAVYKFAKQSVIFVDLCLSGIFSKTIIAWRSFFKFKYA